MNIRFSSDRELEHQGLGAEDMTNKIHYSHLRGITSIIFIAAIVASLPACKRSNSADNQPNSDTVKQNTEQPVAQPDSKEIADKGNLENDAPAIDEQAKKDTNYVVVYSSFREAAKINSDAIDRCFEDFFVNLSKQSEDVMSRHFDSLRSLYITIDADGRLTEAKNRFPYKETAQLDTCLTELIKSFRFPSGKPVTDDYKILEYSKGSKVNDFELGDEIRTCFENHYMNQQLSSDDCFGFKWVVDKDGKANQVQFVDDMTCKNDPDDVQETEKTYNNLIACIKDRIEHSSFFSTTTQKDVPFYNRFYNPYSMDMVDFDDENEDALKACNSKGMVKEDYYGFTWVINPDGSLTDITSENTALDKKVSDCYINLLKDWHFKPTLTGNKLNVYYEFKIGDD